MPRRCLINCSARYDMGSAIGISARERPSGKTRQVLYHFGPADHENGPPVGSCKFAKDGSAGQIRGPDPRVMREQLSGVTVARPARFEELLTRPDPWHFKTLVTRPAGRVMTRQKP